MQTDDLYLALFRHVIADLLGLLFTQAPPVKLFPGAILMNLFGKFRLGVHDRFLFSLLDN